MFKVMMIVGLAVMLLFSLGCIKPTPTQEDEWVMVVKVGSRLAAYEVSKSNPETARVVQGYLQGTDPEKILTYEAWTEFLAELPIDTEWQLALGTVFDLIEVHWGSYTDYLTPFQKRLVSAFVMGTKAGIDLGLAGEQ